MNESVSEIMNAVPERSFPGLDLQAVAGAFEEAFSHGPEVAGIAPGRVNLIGEHIDYLGGTVLPIAVDRRVIAVVGRNGRSEHRFLALQYLEPESSPAVIKAGGLAPRADPSWVNHPLGVAREFELLTPLPGIDVLLHGNLPIGAGLSSSAAIEVALAVALNDLLGTGLPRAEIARLAQRAERKFVGVPCGIMDQTAIACCREDRALRIDCASKFLKTEDLPIPAAVSFIVAHCGVSRRVAASGYRDRQEECSRAFEALRKAVPGPLENLCEIPLEVFEAAVSRIDIDATAGRRARFSIEENGRALRFCDAVVEGDFGVAGTLMNESHSGLRDLFEVSIPALDDLTELARAMPGVFGARMTGAGFGGCAVAMVRSGAARGVLAGLVERYYTPRGIEPLVFDSRPVAGAATFRFEAGGGAPRTPAAARPGPQA